ncbi:MAG: hypothetical protein IPH07_37215 [Deltaproteobacteria bacterium]|nr:hypothetical protein [Deltaproteobacteria bacterium]MBK8713465.1 hypothetical protein [Deltaproteobacteria bacterium]MBP7288090.1 hypothetical protein [Nannocystaceae bacterium]
MKRRLPVALCLASLSLWSGACTDHGNEPAIDPSTASPASEASPDAPVPSTPVVAATEAPPSEPVVVPPPTALHVAVEGRCRYMGVSLVGDDTLVHYDGGDIVRLDASGRAAERVGTALASAEPAPAWQSRVPRIEELGGRYPDALFAEVMEFSREGIRGAYRQTNDGWVELDPFKDNDGGVERLYAWYDQSLLALGAGADGGAKFAVVRGKPKGPRFDRGLAKAGCKTAEVIDARVLAAGDAVATWTCEGKHVFVTHWRRDDLAGHTHDLRVAGSSWERPKDGSSIAFDGKDGFYVVAESSKLWHGHDDAWTEIALPKGAVVRTIEVDPEGHPWIGGSLLARHDGQSWRSITLPDGKPVVELAGVPFGTPWIRTGGDGYENVGGRLWRLDGETPIEIAVPPSAFFEGEALRLRRLHAAGPDDVWAEAEFVVQRRGKGAPGRFYRAVLHSRATAHPLRCGELIDGREITQPYVPWPTASGGTCEQRLSLLMRRKAWDDANDYPKMTKALSRVAGLESVRFVELEIGPDKFFGAIAADAAALELVHKKTKKLRPNTFPELVCGDAAVLDAAGVVVHRELALVTAK